MIRLLLVVLCTLTLAGGALGQGFSVIWYWYDDMDGAPEPPLSDACENGTPLPDGTIIRIYWDNDDNGPDDDDPQPCVWDGWPEPPPPNCPFGMNQFQMNGEFNELGPGYFAMESAWSSGGILPPLPHRYYLRLCIGDIRWESSVVTVHVGAQEIGPSSFGANSYTWNCSGVACGFDPMAFHWFDDGAGEPELPLADSCVAGTPLPDGTPIHIFWDNDGNGPDENDPLPDAGLVNYTSFPMNGEALAMGAGYFTTEIAFVSTGSCPPPYRFFLRICNDSLRWESSVVSANPDPPNDSLTFACVVSPCDMCPRPVPPLNFVASDTLCDGVQLTWGYPGNADGVDQFLLYRGNALIATITDTSQHSYFDDTVISAAIYDIAARRNCSDLGISYSPERMDVGHRIPLPPEATDIDASDNELSQVTVTWLFSSNLGLDYWVIKRDDDSIGTVAFGGLPGLRWFVDENPPDGAHYYDVHAISLFCGEGTSTGGDSGQALPDATDDLRSELITAFALHPAFPNPFNAETVIRFDLPRPGFVTMRVYDVTGRAVTTLANAEFESGRHTLTFSGSDAPSGIYYVRMTSGQFVQTQKLLLLK